MQALKIIIEGMGQAFADQLTPDLLRLLYKATRHPNRFVRETSYHILAAICKVSAGRPLQGCGKEVAVCLQDGLSENWSQVRRTSFDVAKIRAGSRLKTILEDFSNALRGV